MDYHEKIKIIGRKIIDKAPGSSLLLFFLIVLLGLGLRLYNIGTEPFWGDEILSLSIVKHYQNDTAGMLNYLKEVEVHPPLYYLLLKSWIAWFGFGEFPVRALSLIFGLGVIALAFFSAKAIFSNNKIGLLAALFTAILPIQIEYSQEARPYIIFCFFGLASVLALWRFLETRKKIYLALYILSSIAGLYLHYSFFFILGATFSWWLFNVIREKKKEEVLTLAVSAGLIFSGFYYWLPAMLYKIALSHTEILGFKASLPDIRPSGILENCFFRMIWLYKEPYIAKAEILAAGLSKIALMFFLIQAVVKRINRREKLELKSLEPYFFLLWLLFTASLIFLFTPSSYPYSTLTERHVILNSILIILLISGLLFMVRGRLRVLVAALFIISLIPADIRIMADDSLWDTTARFKVVAEHINENYRSGDLVLISYNSFVVDLNFFLDDKIPSDGYYPAKLIWEDKYASRETLGFLENDSQYRIYLPNPDEADRKMNYLMRRYQPKRIWAVYFSTDYQAQVYDWLEERGFRHASKSLGKMFPVDLFIKKADIDPLSARP
jgi:hypothetical protein